MFCELQTQQRWQRHSHEATGSPHDDLICEDVAPPSLPTPHVFAVDHEHFAEMTERDIPASNCARNCTDLTSHAPTFVADVVAVGRIGHAAATRISRKRAEHRDVSQRDDRPCSIRPKLIKDIDQPFLTILLDGDIAELREAAENVPPMLGADEAHTDDQTESQHRSDLHCHHRLQHVVDLASHKHRQGNS